MNRKLIALDLDGTTLDQQSKISSRTKQTLRTLHQQGHVICIVTGRPYRLTKNIYEQLGIDTPMINFNGNSAMIPNRKWSGSYQYTINKKIVLDLLTNHEKLGIELMAAEYDMNMLANRNAPTSFAKETVDFFPAHLSKNQILTTQTLIKDPVEVALHFAPNKLNALTNYIETKYPNQVELSPWGGPHNVVELTTKGVNKATGIKTLMNFYQINRDNTIAFGDQINDISMFKTVGKAVAMKNAVPEIKALASDITEFDNEHDGVAKYLENYFNLDVQPINNEKSELL